MVFSFLQRSRSSQATQRRSQSRRTVPALEALEDRTVPARIVDALYVGDPGPDPVAPGDDVVHRFNATTGEYLGTFVEPGSGNIINPNGIIFGSRGSLLVANQNVLQPINGEVLAFNGKTGAFKEAIVAADDANAPFAPHGIIVNDGTIYVADLDASRIATYHERTGAYLGDLDLGSYSGPFNPRALVVGPDGYLYVSVMDISDPPNGSILAGWIVRFDLAAGSFHDVFAANALADLTDVNDLHRPDGMAFGPDGKLYVPAVRGSTMETDKILIFNPANGVLEGHIDLDVVGGSRAFALTCVFGPDGKLFVPITQGDAGDSGSVRRYDVATGTFDVFVPPTASGGPMTRPQFLTFGRTDSATLEYQAPRHALHAEAQPKKRSAQVSLTASQASTLLTEAVARWEATGVNVAALDGVRIQVANLPGSQLGYAAGNTIWLDSNAAGWGWFVDQTPRNDSEFSQRGDQGEKRHVDLLSVLMHETGHLLGFAHSDVGVMQDNLSAGTRWSATRGVTQVAGHSAVDAYFAWLTTTPRRTPVLN